MNFYLLFYFILLVTAIPKKQTLQGSCGFSCKWSISTDKTKLTISGSGEMDDFYSYSSIPWHSYLSSITSIEFTGSVTSIGQLAFSETIHLQSIQMSQIEEIGEAAFYHSGIQTIIIPSSVTIIGENAFEQSSIKDVSFESSSNLKIIKNKAFKNCVHMESISLPQNLEEIERLQKEMPSDGFRMGLTMMVAMPLVIAYPFFQKYFVKGITIGAVKG